MATDSQKHYIQVLKDALAAKSITMDECILRISASSEIDKAFDKLRGFIAGGSISKEAVLEMVENNTTLSPLQQDVLDAVDATLATDELSEIPFFFTRAIRQYAMRQIESYELDSPTVGRNLVRMIGAIGTRKHMQDLEYLHKLRIKKSSVQLDNPTLAGLAIDQDVLRTATAAFSTLITTLSEQKGLDRLHSRQSHLALYHLKRSIEKAEERNRRSPVYQFKKGQKVSAYSFDKMTEFFSEQFDLEYEEVGKSLRNHMKWGNKLGAIAEQLGPNFVMCMPHTLAAPGDLLFDAALKNSNIELTTLFIDAIRSVYDHLSPHSPSVFHCKAAIGHFDKRYTSLKNFCKTKQQKVDTEPGCYFLKLAVCGFAIHYSDVEYYLFSYLMYPEESIGYGIPRGFTKEEKDAQEMVDVEMDEYESDSVLQYIPVDFFNEDGI
ncbi:hypothetical protein BJ508DRAFT_333153 [Ascobolus immersus RN42]|uniref:Uncharacterized protein n=1 Tax=Ascobolus immersus RN42 TaxID=1160509 RepID=A0A3N4HKP7_ASCIM|nr:hypothetical protein BJ508DRAFT_333153 [Ascobolus immersus RN42]